MNYAIQLLKFAVAVYIHTMQWQKKKLGWMS